MQRFVCRVILSIISFFLALDASAMQDINTLGGMSFIAAFWVYLGMVAIVYAILIYSLIKLRQSKDAKTVYFHKHISIEILWTTIPFLIMVLLVVPAMLVLAK